jgi:transposase
MKTGSKLNKELIEKAVKYIEQGNYIETVAAFLGISRQSFYDWIRRGSRNCEVLDAGNALDKKEEIYVDFFIAVEQARAVAEMADLNIIKDAAEKRWEAAAWRLERRSPDKWGRRSEVKADVTHDGAINLVMSIPDIDDGSDD